MFNFSNQFELVRAKYRDYYYINLSLKDCSYYYSEIALGV